jgi:transglutaminase-like putative cysteine protease
MSQEFPPPPPPPPAPKKKTNTKLAVSAIALVAIIVVAIFTTFSYSLLSFPSPQATDSPTPFSTQTPLPIGSPTQTLAETPIITSSASPEISPSPTSTSYASPSPTPSNFHSSIMQDVQNSGIAGMSLATVKNMMRISNNENMGTLIFSPTSCTGRYYAQALSFVLKSEGWDSREVYAFSAANTMKALVAVFYVQDQGSRLVLIDPNTGTDVFSVYDGNGDGQLTYYNSGNVTGLTQNMWVYYGVSSTTSMYFGYDSLSKDGKYLMVTGDTRNSPQRYEEFRFVQEFKIDASQSQRFDLKFSVPPNIPNAQRIISTTYSVTPTQVVTDQLGNTIVTFTNFQATAGRAGYITATTIVELNVTSCGIKPDTGVYNTSSAIYIQYTKPETYIESNNTQIFSAAQTITAGYSDPASKARAICRWVYDNLTYVYSPSEKGALAALSSGTGKCTEFSDLFVALCRASGIPAGVVNGQWITQVTSWGLLSQTNSENTSSHQWAEVYLPSQGWVTMDPTANQYPVTDGEHITAQVGGYVSALSGYNQYCYNYYGATSSIVISENLYLYPYP